MKKQFEDLLESAEHLLEMRKKKASVHVMRNAWKILETSIQEAKKRLQLEEKNVNCPTCQRPMREENERFHCDVCRQTYIEETTRNHGALCDCRQCVPLTIKPL